MVQPDLSSQYSMEDFDNFSSYTSDHRDYLEVVYYMGWQPHSVHCSVPQGSMLGPKKFIAYTEDQANVVS